MSKIRCLPERTVDAWTATVVASAYPAATIWAPTQMVPVKNWDFTLSLTEGSVFVFEDKGAFPRRGGLSHGLEITQPQLDVYCDIVDLEWGIPSYYVLPRPPAHVGQQEEGTLFHAAHRRGPVPALPFEEWTYVVRCHDLRSALRTRSGTGSSSMRSSVLECDDELLTTAPTLAEFLKKARSGSVGTALSILLRQARSEGQARLDPVLGGAANHYLSRVTHRRRTDGLESPQLSTVGLPTRLSSIRAPFIVHVPVGQDDAD
jgi:hypothetical protein